MANRKCWTGAYLPELRLFKSLTVLDNVLVAARAEYEAGWAGVLLGTPRAGAEELELVRHAEEALQFVGLSDLRYVRVSKLPHEQQRLIEIARAFVMRPKLILLDEPSAGMNPIEVEKLSSTTSLACVRAGSPSYS